MPTLTFFRGIFRARRVVALASLFIGLCSAIPVGAADYLVIDISGGPSANTYPVSTLDSPPAGGWTDEYKTSKIVLRRIPAGTFMIGAPEGSLGLTDWRGVKTKNEVHYEVTLTRDYLIGVFEVTQRQWELVMDDNPSKPENDPLGAKRPVTWAGYSGFRGSTSSVNWPTNNYVTPDSFAGRLRARTGIPDLDLPTDAQWEYACRAGTTTDFNDGGNMTGEYEYPNINRIARNIDNSKTQFPSGPQPTSGTAFVGSYLPNAWGLYDMHGNVWEYCVDRYMEDPSSLSRTDPVGPTSGANYAARGGGHVSNARNCRSSRRRGLGASGNADDYGVRLAAHSVPAIMEVVPQADVDGDGFTPDVASDDPLFDPDDSNPYAPFVDANGNFVPDNYDNDATSPKGDFSPTITLQIANGETTCSVRLSVGVVYHVEKSTDLENWADIPVWIEGVEQTTFTANAPGTIQNVVLASPVADGTFYRLSAQRIPLE